MFEAMRKNPSVHWFRIAFLAVLWMSSRGAGVPCVEERVLEYLGYEFMTAQWHSYKGKGASLTLYFRTLSARLNTADILKLILHEDNLKCREWIHWDGVGMRKYKILLRAFRFNRWITMCLFIFVAFLCVWKFKSKLLWTLSYEDCPKIVCCWDNEW